VDTGKLIEKMNRQKGSYTVMCVRGKISERLQFGEEAFLCITVRNNKGEWESKQDRLSKQLKESKEYWEEYKENNFEAFFKALDDRRILDIEYYLNRLLIGAIA